MSAVEKLTAFKDEGNVHYKNKDYMAAVASYSPRSWLLFYISGAMIRGGGLRGRQACVRVRAVFFLLLVPCAAHCA